MHYKFYSLIFIVFWAVTIVYGQTDPCWSNPCRNNARCMQINGGTDYMCICPEGLLLTGKNCDQRITTTPSTTITTVSPCLQNPCFNGGACIVLPSPNSYFCQCPEYTYGSHCENLNRCFIQPTPCQNNGLCIPGPNSAYSCSCSSQYTGIHCETFISLASICTSVVCLNGGTCLALNDNTIAFCQCRPGYSGSRCVCSPSPCKNGASCFVINNNNDYVCGCAPRYTGKNCETIVASCNSALCYNGGTCVLMSDGTTFKCACQPGYTGDRCMSVITRNCISQPCRNGGTCSEGPFTYECKCSSPFRGKQCETVTSVYSPCDSNPCKNTGTCNVSGNSYTCTCAPGYTGNTCELDMRPAVCELNCLPGYCFANSAGQPAFACFCMDNTIRLKTCS
ncbi:unnamed protein product [Rotaria sp. Silwood2]|nr:unnamed protein product [Rotaria sp. Silwood2]